MVLSSSTRIPFTQSRTGSTITRMNSFLSSPRSMDTKTTHRFHTDFQADTGHMETTEVCSGRTFEGSHFKRPALVSGLTHSPHWELRSYSEVSHQQVHKDSGRKYISKSYLISGFQCIYQVLQLFLIHFYRNWFNFTIFSHIQVKIEKWHLQHGDLITGKRKLGRLKKKQQNIRQSH